MEQVLWGGRVVDPASGLDGRRELWIRDGMIAKVLPEGEKPKDVPGLDLSGRWIFPGLIDLHVHLREPGDEGKETIESGSRAAVAGGFTAVVAMPNTRPVNDNRLVTELILRRAAEAGRCRVYPAGAITKGLQGAELSEMGELVGAGCVCLTDDGRPVMNASLMRRALEYARIFDVPVMAHEEDLSLSLGGAAHDGPTAHRLGLMPIPRSAEVAMVARDLVLAEEVGGRLHLAHLSCEESVRSVREAKRRGVRVTAEVTPHHLFLTDQAVDRYRTEAKMNPPLREERDTAALREALADGTIDAIATDHAPHGALDKQVEFDKAANGVVGLETALGLALELVHQRRLTLLRMVELFTVGPAKAFGLPGGQIRAGAPADLTVVDPLAKWIVDPSSFFSKSTNSPFVGRALQGRVTHTFVGGKLVYEGGGIR